MKQKLTFLFILCCFVGNLYNNAFGQIMLIEGFEGPAFPPNGPYGQWTLHGGGSIYPFGCPTAPTNWVQTSVGQNFCASAGAAPLGQVHQGSASAGFPGGELQACSGQLVSPSLYFPGTASAFSQYKLTFWVYTYNYFNFGADDSLIVGLSTSPTTYTPIASEILPVGSSVPFTGWQQITMNLGVPAAGNYYLFFNSYHPQSYTANWYIDDISLIHYTPCSGAPVSGISGPTNICPFVPFTLIDSAIAGFSGISYVWQSRPAGSGNYTTIAGANTAIYNCTGISAATDYRVIAHCANSGLTDTAFLTVNTNPFYLCYCGPALNQSLNSAITNIPHIDSVGITGTTLQNATYTPVPFNNDYIIFPQSGNTTATFRRGGTYRVAVATNVVGAFGAAWLDYSRNGTFAEPANPGEYIPLTGIPSSNLLTGTFTVPQNADTGLTGFRVRSKQTAYTNANNSCSKEPNGETEDYIVKILPALYNDLGATAVILPATNDISCANTNMVVRVAIANMGSAAQSNFNVYAQYNGPVSNVIQTTYTGTLQPYAKDTINIGMINLPVHGNYYITAYTSLVNDQNHLNDTTVGGLFTVTEVPFNPVVTNDTVCINNPAAIVITPVTGNTYNWYSAPAGGTVLFTGNQKTFANLTNSTYYFVSAKTPGVNDSFLHTPYPVLTGAFPARGGIHFDVLPAENLIVDSLSAKFRDTGLHIVNVYYHISQPNPSSPNYPLSYTAPLLNSAAYWTLLGNTAIYVSPGTINQEHYINLFASLPMTSGNGVLYSFYVDADLKVGPQGNLTFPPVTFGAGNQLYFGKRLNGAFNGVSDSSYKFNGNVYYHTGGSACESQRIPVEAIIGPTPVVNLPPSGLICWVPGLHLDAGNPNSQFTWTKDGNTLANTSEILPIPLSDTSVNGSSHLYTVSVTRYCTVTDSTRLEIVPPPFVSGINYTQQGNTYYFSTSGTRDVLFYYWLFGDGVTSTLATPVHTYNDANPHSVKLVVYNTCGSDTLTWTVPTLMIPGMNTESSALQLYPNPANTVINLSTTNNATINDIYIVNAVGAVVIKTSGSYSNSDQINISLLAPGHYFMRVNTSEGVVMKRFEILR
jgi:hypothetical protein